MSDSSVSRAQARRARRRAEAEEAAGDMTAEKRATLNDKNKAVQDELEAERRAWREKNQRGGAPTARPVEDLDDEAKLFAKVDDIQDRNQESLANSIRMASEATQSASQTMDQLERQREQLARMDGTLADTNASLNRSERIIRGMKSIGGSITNWFTKPKADVSQKSEITKKMEAGQKVVADEPISARSSSTSSKTSSRPTTHTSSHDIVIDDKQFKNTRNDDDDFTPEQKQKLSKIEQRQQVEDEQLDVLSGLLTQLHSQAKDIHNELNVQHQLIDDVGHHVDSTSARIQNANRQIAKIG